MPIATATAMTMVASAAFDLESGLVAQSKMTGVVITIPVASKSHHLAQATIDTAAESARPNALAMPVPAAVRVELIIAIGAKAMTINFMMSTGELSLSCLGIQ